MKKFFATIPENWPDCVITREPWFSCFGSWEGFEAWLQRKFVEPFESIGVVDYEDEPEKYVGWKAAEEYARRAWLLRAKWKTRPWRWLPNAKTRRKLCFEASERWHAEAERLLIRLERSIEEG